YRIRLSSAEKDAPFTEVVPMNCSIVYARGARGLGAAAGGAAARLEAAKRAAREARAALAGTFEVMELSRGAVKRRPAILSQTRRGGNRRVLAFAPAPCTSSRERAATATRNGRGASIPRR